MPKRMPRWARTAALVIAILAAWFVLTIVTFDSVPDAVILRTLDILLTSAPEPITSKLTTPKIKLGQ
jgi:hypothetical protein